MRVLLSGGGTAGHVNPALAIAQTIQRNSPSSEFAYVTTKKGIEKRLVPYKQYEINVTGLKRSFSFSNLKTIFLTFNAISECKKIIKDFNPDIIVGTGGYACYPVIYAGKSLGVKTVLHESNALPGKAIRMLEDKVDKIFLNFKEAERYFKNKDKLVYSGNPIREGFGTLNKDEARRRLGIKEKYVVLCYGGSLGATAINEGAIQVIENLIKDDKEIRFVWASGKREYKEMYYLLRDKGLEKLKNLDFNEYIYDMPEKIASADVVICRAGAMSISEMAFSGKCAIFIPSPNVVDNHQYKNAYALSSASAGILMAESEIYNLTDTVKELLEDDAKRQSFSKRIRTFSVKESNKIIYEEIRKLVKDSKSSRKN